MTLRDIFRAIANRPEPVVVTPIRLAYTFDDGISDDAAAAEALHILNRARSSNAGIIESLLASVYGDSWRDDERPATIVRVCEIHRLVGRYSHAASAWAVQVEIELLTAADEARIAKRTFDQAPPEHISAPLGRGKPPGNVSGGFPRREVETWLRSFPVRSADPPGPPGR